MRSLIVLSCIISVLVFAACNSSSKKQIEFVAAPKGTTPKKDYSNVVFAPKKDTTCSMPLSAGVGEAVQWKNKVYGFVQAM